MKVEGFKKRVLIGLGALLLAGGAFAYWVYAGLTTPRAHGSADRIIGFEQGLGTRRIVARLVHDRVVSTQLPLLLYLTFSRDPRPLQAGDYQFESPISPLQVVEKLRKGQIVTKSITIPEGFNLYEIEETLKTRDFADPEAADMVPPALRQTNLVADLDPKAATLEGYLFPATYTFSKRATDAQIVAQMVKRFHEVFTPDMRKRAQDLGLTVREVVTMASIIEKEARVDEDRPLISSVIHNRLKKGMRLECDPTFMYAALLEGRWDGNVNNPAHRQSLSPYNTYAVAGLPPGPIASPGLKSLQAALNPAQTSYLYFVANSGGKHRFSTTGAEHQAAVAEYRRLQGRK